MAAKHETKDEKGVLVETFELNDWLVTTNKCHILNSKCTSSFICNKTRERLLAEKVIKPKETEHEGGTPSQSLEQLVGLKKALDPLADLCNYCKYDITLAMAHFPDMTYSNNLLRLHHKPSGLVIEFNTMEALFPVLDKSIGLPHGLKVSSSEAWLKTRMDSEYARNVVNAAFDWTFSSDYAGTIKRLTSDGESVDVLADDASMERNVSDRIDLEKLKAQQEILFFDEIDLFEDELADHGVAKCCVKIRVMSDAFFVLLRFFLRVDNVFVRYYDTRYYHEFGQNFVLREFTNREATIAELGLNEDDKFAVLADAVKLYYRVPENTLIVDKIHIDKLQS